MIRWLKSLWQWYLRVSSPPPPEEDGWEMPALWKHPTTMRVIIACAFLLLCGEVFDVWPESLIVKSLELLVASAIGVRLIEISEEE